MNFTEDISLEVAQLAVDFKGTLVTGLDVAGDAANFTFDKHRAAFALAKAAGVCITIHAGEADGAASIWEALDVLGADRIGHGVRAVEDDMLVRRLATDRIHLETCPCCNIQIGLGLDQPVTMANHPIHELRAKGVSLGISWCDLLLIFGSVSAGFLYINQTI